jgi:hypothetical protein
MIHENSNVQRNAAASPHRSLPRSRPSDPSPSPHGALLSFPSRTTQTNEREKRQASFRTWPVQKMPPLSCKGRMLVLQLSSYHNDSGPLPVQQGSQTFFGWWEIRSLQFIAGTVRICCMKRWELKYLDYGCVLASSVPTGSRVNNARMWQIIEQLKN